MADIVAILAKAVDSDREGPVDGDYLSRPDYPLIMANDRAIPALMKLCKDANIVLKVVSMPNLSLEDVREAISEFPDAIIAIYGHGCPSIAQISNRRKKPNNIIADHSIVPNQSPGLCVYACYSMKISDNLEERPPFIGFNKKAYVPCIDQVKQCFQSSHVDLIIEAYDIAFVTPAFALFQTKDASLVVFECQEQLIDMAERFRELHHETRNPYFLVHIEMVEKNQRRIKYL